jgi:hypothetical protein
MQKSSLRSTKSIYSSAPHIITPPHFEKIPEVRGAKSTNPLNPIYTKLTAVQSTKNACKIDPMVSYQPATFIESVRVFCDFSELVDKGLSGCSLVVRIFA